MPYCPWKELTPLCGAQWEGLLSTSGSGFGGLKQLRARVVSCWRAEGPRFHVVFAVKGFALEGRFGARRSAKRLSLKGVQVSGLRH